MLWIVVGCAYKSDLTGMIVKPVYVQPPATFTELVESDYKIGVLFYSGNLEENFVAWNTSVSRAIQARKYVYDFLEPDVSKLFVFNFKIQVLWAENCTFFAVLRKYYEREVSLHWAGALNASTYSTIMEIPH